MTAALSQNKWGAKGQTTGISQAMDNFNRASFICLLRKFVIPMKQDGGKIEEPRHVSGGHTRMVQQKVKR
jgi:hypothetical protein